MQAAFDETADKFGGIDIVLNNASSIQLTPVTATDMRRYDLMQQINARGTFMVSKFAIPYLTRRENPHILMLSPPLDMAEKWFAPHTAYSMAKFGMSLVVLGLAGELRGKVAVHALWPRTTSRGSQCAALRWRRGKANRCRSISLCRTPVVHPRESAWTQSRDRHFHDGSRMFRSRECLPFSSAIQPV